VTKPRVNAVKLRQQAHAATMFLVPFVGTVLAITLGIRDGIGPIEIALLCSMYLLTMLGISIGFHRHASHGAFDARPAARWALLALGSMAAQGSVFYWVTNHRRHHHRSDRPGDPHSPVFDGERALGGLRGLLHAHVGWTFAHGITNVFEYGKDLYKDPLLRRVDRSYYTLVTAGILAPALIAGLATWSIRGAVLGMLWGGLVRMFVVQHLTLATNSITHAFGTQPFTTKDHSRNHGVLALLNAGEGWHNNHHAFPFSAYTGIEPWQIDVGGWLVAGLEKCSLVFNVKRPTATAIAKARRTKQEATTHDREA
jgi:stearoyl-CoA desaturase (delta-9 desaturase)